jgi:hypothetical protein
MQILKSRPYLRPRVKVATAPATAEAAVAARRVVAALAAARDEGRAQAVEIVQICQLAGRPELARMYLTEGMTPTQVRAALIAKSWDDAFGKVHALRLRPFFGEQGR